MWFSQENEDQRRSQNPEQTPPYRPQTPVRLRFSKSARIVRRSHFLSLMKQGTRFTGASVKIEYRQGGKAPFPKLGITVSRRYGKAHARNRFKRVVREVFRQLAPTLPHGLELHVSPKGAEQRVTVHDILSDLKKMIGLLQRV
jgi:ribonuclease P protein component